MLPVSGVLQRACACGQHSGSGGECESCKRNRLALQRSAVSQDSPDIAPPTVHQVLRSPGRPLDESTSRFMEARFPRDLNRVHSPSLARADDELQVGPPDNGYEREARWTAAHVASVPTASAPARSIPQADFGAVRVHTGSQAHQSTQDVGARAYTVGNHIVFGNGQYDPQTAYGQRLLAHELAHVMQQGGDVSLSGGATSGPVYLQRQSLGQAIELGYRAGGLAAEWYAEPRNRQFIEDLRASVRESPDHIGEILVGEIWEAVRENWPQVLAVTLLLLGAEILIGILAGVPEPTMLTKVVSAILQILVIAALGYFAAVELTNVYEHGRLWFSQAREANGDPRQITESSRSFLRMIRHIILAILLVAGVRTRIRAAGLPRGAGAIGGGGGAGGGAPAELPENVIPITRPPQVRPTALPRPSTGSQPAFEGSAARQLAPAEPATVPEPVTVPQPATAPAPTTAPAAATARPPLTRGLTPGAAAAAGVSTALEEEEPRARAYPICWPIQLGPIEPRHFANAGLPLNSFVRTRSPDRDYEEQQQAALVRRWLREYRDPSFDAQRFHVHHVIPLFLGGPDELMINGLTLEGRLHLRGHNILRYQPQMAAPPPPLPPLDPDMYTHPPGTPYVLVGYKATRDEVCG